MGFYDTKEGVDGYIKMTKGYDGTDLIKVLKNYLKSGSKVLELGMGPGKDLDILKKRYDAVGSDYSKEFLNKYKEKHKNAKLLHLDATTLKTDKKFNCLYSNKVLHHLTKAQLKKSIKRQKQSLTKNGILFHTFWLGNKTEKYKGLLFVHYTIPQIAKLFEDYEILEIKNYKEFKKHDSAYIVAMKK